MGRLLVTLWLLFPGLSWADALEEAAQKGDAAAQMQVGSRYAEGEGVAQNMTEAAKWYAKAAEQGNADAQVYLGILYENGEGVTKNLATAAKWYTKAAEQDHDEAQYYLAIMLAYGNGVPKDVVQACKWLELAAKKGEPKVVRARDAIVKLMTPQQIVEARKQSREFKPVKK